MTKRFVRRKWGWYWTILDRKHFKVKLLRFNEPPCACSKQYHNFRNELWLFLTGNGRFDQGDSGNVVDYLVVDSGDYRMVNMRDWHQFIPYCKSLILEIQFGAKCTEEDIVRI